VHSLEFVEAVPQGCWDKLALREMVKLHVDHSTIDTFDRGRIANRSLDTITAPRCMATVDAAKTNLANHNGMLPPRRRCIYIMLCCGEDFDILIEGKKRELV
jgi:hypothetical protein